MAEYLDSLEPIKASLEKSPLLSTPCHHHISRHRFLPPITRSISQPMPSLPYHIETPFVFIIPTLSATVRKVRQSYRRPVAHTFSHLISSHIVTQSVTKTVSETVTENSYKTVPDTINKMFFKIVTISINVPSRFTPSKPCTFVKHDLTSNISLASKANMLNPQSHQSPNTDNNTLNSLNIKISTQRPSLINYSNMKKPTSR